MRCCYFLRFRLSVLLLCARARALIWELSTLFLCCFLCVELAYACNGYGVNVLLLFPAYRDVCIVAVCMRLDLGAQHSMSLLFPACVTDLRP